MELIDSGRRYALGRRDDTYYVWEKRRPKRWLEYSREINARQELWYLEDQARVIRRRRWSRVGVVGGLLIGYGIAVGIVLVVNDGPSSFSRPVPERLDTLTTVAAGRHANAEGGFTFRAPGGWLLGDTGATTELASPDGTVSISITTAPEGSIDDSAASALDDLSADWEGVTTEPPQSRTVGTLPALSVSGTATDEAGTPIRFLSLVANSGERNHVISVTVPETWDLVAFMPAIDGLLSSFRAVESPGA